MSENEELKIKKKKRKKKERKMRERKIVIRNNVTQMRERKKARKIDRKTERYNKPQKE